MRKKLGILKMWPFLWASFLPNVHAQVNEQFADLELANNPPWVGQTSKFTVTTAAQLRLMNSGTDTAYIATASTLLGVTEWSFWFRLAFAPSSQNYLLVYLASDSPTLDGPLNGFYVRYGESGSNDGLELWRQTGTTHVRIFDGAANPNATSTNQQVRCRVRRDATGTWELFADYTGGNNLQSLGTTYDPTIIQPQFLGVACVHTSSNSDKFYLDDIYCGPWVIDTQPPEVVAVAATSETSVEIKFNEPLQGAPASITTNFFIDQGIGIPLSAQLDNQDPAKVLLELSTPLSSGVTYHLTVIGQKDLAGNMMSPSTVSFLFYLGEAFDVLINEIMADPTPVVGLPPHEYVELYNTNSFPVDISGWKIKIGSTTRVIPSGSIIAPDSFLVLTDLDAFAALQEISVVGIQSFPSISNTGTTIQLQTPTDKLIHKVRFEPSWYGNPAKDDGGWSLEMRNPQEPCVQKSNWTASQNPSGGTPGRRNSVYQNVAIPLAFSNALCDDSLHLRLIFNKRLDTASLHTGHFSFQPPLQIQNILYRSEGDTVVLKLAQPIVPNVIYTITFSGPLPLCNGHVFSGSIHTQFVLPRTQPLDVVITEIMADESPAVNLPAMEYLELYNRTGLPINLTGWSLTVGSSTEIFSGGYIPPDSFVVVTAPLGFDLFSTGLVVPMEGFPAVSNEGTTIILRDPRGKVIHAVSYSNAWYQEAGKSDGGWSLEMIDPTTPCLGRTNWKASAHPDGGTPGYRNSRWTTHSDKKPAILKFVGAATADTLIAWFSEGLHPGRLSPDWFALPGSGLSVKTAEILNPDYSLVKIGLDNYLQPHTSYTLVVADSLRDCALNQLGVADSQTFALPRPPQPGDIVLNEILFNPRGDGSEFVEIFNRSLDYLDINGMKLCKADSATQALISIKETANFSLILQPGRYLVFTDNAENVMAEYPGGTERNFLEIPSHIDVNNSGGTVAITNASLTVLDMLSFDEDWHYQVIKDPDGVSLERINPWLPTQNKSNWNSAAATVNYGTPSYQNSQFLIAPASQGEMALYPEVFSPDNDGYHDVLLINFNLDKSGYFATVQIFDEAGRLVHSLARNLLLPAQATLAWNGQDASGAKCRIGYYVVVAELFHEDGSKKR
ncbi:MAG: lamin tail domain-containing protein, partial [Flavobacteriales bacterium]|nr:lamin tail domain-containing protein [Flavobacteriales bacterium]MDW8409919.1 lamin tail domain-containing protein [Flavobacteriales bacterium]